MANVGGPRRAWPPFCPRLAAGFGFWLEMGWGVSVCFLEEKTTNKIERETDEHGGQRPV